MMDDATFRNQIFAYSAAHGRRDLPWRRGITPYRILVSEVMLQQTQVHRVVPKFREFLRAFPTFRALARARVSAILSVWQGLGYNRRALMLRDAALAVVSGHAGKMPDTYPALVALPGIGPYTAGAILAFAFDRASTVIETNIRRVYLHHFFQRRRNVPDSEIIPHIIRHVSLISSPRDWYGALMDYGSYLGKQSKKSEGGMSNANKRSKHYTRQSRFDGSVRQIRGKILKVLLASGPMSKAKIASAVGPDERFRDVLTAMVREGFIHRQGSGGRYGVVY